MRTQRLRKQPAVIRYMLSADPRLRRISLRRISARIMPVRRSPRPKASGSRRREVRLPRTHNGRMAAMTVMAVVIALALLTTRRPTPLAVSASSMTPLAPSSSTPLLDETPTSTAVVSTKGVAAAQTQAGATAAKPRSTDPAVALPRGSRPTKAPTPEPASTAASSGSSSITSVERRPADVQGPVPVTIMGCLVLDEDIFWLKDTTGADAPKSRSWRSGFLRKRSTSIELLDATHTGLSRYVGQRVAATGALVDHQLGVRSVEPVAGACD